MKASAEMWILLIFIAAVVYMLVRPGSPAPAAISSLAGLMANSAMVITGG